MKYEITAWSYECDCEGNERYKVHTWIASGELDEVSDEAAKDANDLFGGGDYSMNVMPY